ncbi:efflux RND transporter periplasmic adaptor subunit [Methylobacterium gnaphalii]|uniref:Cation efflux system protein n=1 Tax=Methylobacterium gnaphalii TaxID=1010610 RepID=A0A512JG06_9HYPH|nr:efflux RND transporter periplasmic adaptor subunit [Methylobacterium gnaphalii]GEP08885.1 cation efflux system protein [Methylobacterium gnaphalii]GJD70651.1 Multidrug resistance protein MdtA [Methylobacterium gnaphalii]GLS47650.1 cation efflux system protein [Methylobacterium gnaphalii]
MSRSAWAAGTLAALAAGILGYGAGHEGNPVPALLRQARTEFAHWLPGARPGSSVPLPVSTKATGPVVYYQDPDGRPSYASEPTRTADGRDYRAVRASEDVRFDEPDEPGTMPNAGHGDMSMAQATAPATGARKVRFYRNPMGLPDTSPVPKKDSMGMDYLPVYEGEDIDDGTVALSPGKVQRTGVRTAAAERRVLSRPVRAPGTIEEDERRISVIAMRTDAFIEKVEAVTTGDHVHKGQPLMRLFSPEMNAAAAQYLTGIGYEGARRRLENLGIPPEVIDEVERTRKVPSTITWSAPRDGVVVERNVSEGMRAKSGDTLFKLVDHSRVWVLVDVPERDLASVAEGQAAIVRARTFPDRAFTGTVTRIYPHLAMGTRTARLRIELPNPNGDLRPGMYADVEIATGNARPVVSVPDDAVIDTGVRQVVLLDRGEGRFEPRQVRLGTRGDGYVEVRDGIAAGDRVVTSANFLIDAESNLKAALQGLSEPKADPGPQAAADGRAP